MLSFAGVDHFGIEGKSPEEIPECPAGYLYCPGCNKVTKLRGATLKFWFGTCLKCQTRISYRIEDSAIAYVQNGILYSMGMEGQSFQIEIGEKVKYPYVR